MHTRSTTLLALVASLLLAGCPSGGAQPDASDASPGDATLDPDGAVPVQCDQANGCATCAAIVGCGWCASTHACLAASADETQSADMSCTGSAWDYFGATCTGPGSLMDRCTTTGGASCGACLTVDNCGWCNAGNRCVPANSDSTGAFDGTCTGADWSYLPSDCPGYDGGAAEDAAAGDSA